MWFSAKIVDHREGEAGLMINKRTHHSISVAPFSPLPRYSGGEGLGVRGNSIMRENMMPNRLILNPLTPSLSP